MAPWAEGSSWGLHLKASPSPPISISSHILSILKRDVHSTGVAQGVWDLFLRLSHSPGGHRPHKLREQEGGWYPKAGALLAQDGYGGCPMEQQMGLSNAMLRNSSNPPRCREGCDRPIFWSAWIPGLLHPPSPPGQGTAIVPDIPWAELGLTVALQPFARQEGGQEWILLFTGTRATSSPSLPPHPTGALYTPGQHHPQDAGDTGQP